VTLVFVEPAAIATNAIAVPAPATNYIPMEKVEDPINRIIEDMMILIRNEIFLMSRSNDP
jgi:hypothetical protein